MWQSLAFEPNYKAAYCLAVCPAGEEVIAPYLRDKAGFKRAVLKPLTMRRETVYVVPESDAETHAARRFPHKQIKRVGNGLRARTIEMFLSSLPLVFQRDRSAGLNARYHFTFTGERTEARVEQAAAGPATVEATIVIRDKQLTVHPGHVGQADMRVVADAQTWLGFVAKEKSLVWALMTRKIRLRGRPQLLIAFGRCFPS